MFALLAYVWLNEVREQEKIHLIKIDVRNNFRLIHDRFLCVCVPVCIYNVHVDLCHAHDH